MIIQPMLTPMIDYDLALLIQPMLMLGVSIGVGLNVIFANWMVTVLLIIIFLGISIKPFLKGVQTWKKETLMKKEATKSMETNGTLPGTEGAECRDLLNGQPPITASGRAPALKNTTSTADRVVSSATSTFAMTFSSSMSVVEYYLLNRFPVPYGQHVVGKLIKQLGRASLIVFVLALTIFVSAILLGSVGISNMAKRIDRHEYMGLADICKVIS